MEIHPLLNDIVCLDYESIEIQPDGSTQGSTEAYRDNFRVDSAAFTWVEEGALKSKFVAGEDAVREALMPLQGKKLLVFNAQFETLVTLCRYPDLKLNITMDAQRLVQVYDNGGDKNAFETIIIEPEDIDDETVVKRAPLAGFGLVKSMKRIMHEESHKEEAHAWIRANCGVKKGKEGAFLDKLPADILERYNIGDTEATFRLANFILHAFDKMGYDFQTDHTLYLGAARRIAESKKLGIPCDRVSLRKYADETHAEMDKISLDFITQHTEPIKGVVRQLKLERIRKLKTLKGRKKYLRKGAKNKDWPKLTFNPGSGRQLAMLFVDVLKIEPFFFTEKGSPSTKASHLYQYGAGGKMLEKRKKRQIVVKQAEAIIEKTSYDGRLHIDLRAVGTVTGRFAGSGGVNVQALSRRDPGLMTTLLPDPGYIFVSIDATGGEPTVLTQYTKDFYYRYFCFDGVGKKPYYDGDVLMIDDIYLGFASVCDLFSAELRKVFDTWTYQGRSFADQWTIDPEKCKDALKSLRKNAKWIALAMGYGLGPKTLYKKGIEAGLKVTTKLCRQAFQAYWSLFAGIKGYATRLEEHTELHGWFQNDFGYRFVPTEKRKSFNGMIQSSVSSIFHWYSDLVEIKAPYSRYVTTIHDENIYQIPKDLVETFRQDVLEVADHMNEQLQWDVKLRFGYAVGDNLFTAK